MRVCVMIDYVGPDASYSLVSPEIGSVAYGFHTEYEAEKYAEDNGLELM